MFTIQSEQASELAPQIDWIHDVITAFSVFFTVAICGVMIYFAIKYRKRNGVDHETPQIEGSSLLEIIWTVVPTLISIYVAYYGVVIYHDMRSVPEGALTIDVTGRKWDWSFDYSGKKKTDKEFVVPVNTPIKLVLSSRDVIHSFFIPSMRVKRDAIPGQYSFVSFTPVKTGEYNVFCTEYCGLDHSKMLAKLKVVSEDEFTRWLNYEEPSTGETGVEMGARLYTEKGCVACHSLDGSKVVGPTFLKLSEIEREFDDGTKAVADENYLKSSILNPRSQIVKGYPAKQMPVFEGLLSDQEVDSLIDFIQSVDGTTTVVPVDDASNGDDLSALSPEERGEHYYQNKLCITCHSIDGSKKVGPSLKGLYGKNGELADGSTYLADDAYITKSILEPNSEIVKGYAPGMVPNLLTEEEIPDIIAYIKTLK